MRTFNRPHYGRALRGKIKPSSYLIIALALAACQSNSLIVENPSAVSAPIIIQQPHIPVLIDDSDNEVIAEFIEPSIEDLWERIRNGFQLQATYDHPSVDRYINTYGKNQRLFDLVTQRAAPYLYHIVEAIEERGLPMELALLPIVESTFNPNAYSQEHAVGLWQFIGPTARSFGVDFNWWYDGRRDPLAATPAALEYLSVLHTQFNENWLVAIGAYNTGDGNVRRAIRRGKQDASNVDFWTLPLAPETRSHVPKLLALAAIVENIELYEVELKPLVNAPTHTLVQLPAQMDINQAALMMDLDYDELKQLNPGYLQWATHPDAPHSLFVPIDKAARLKTEVANTNPAQLLTWDRYAIQDGDTLSRIAKNLGTRVDVLMHANNLRNSSIVAGDSLLVPRNITSLDDMINIPSAPPFQSRPSVRIPTTYRIRSGDNLWSIARKFNLKSSDIARANEFDPSTLLFPGQQLDLSYAMSSLPDSPQASSVATIDKTTYRVNRGDSVDKIARKFGHSILEILQWNDLTETQLIHPGQEIRLAPQDLGIN